MKKRDFYQTEHPQNNGICQNTAGVHPACATAQRLQSKAKGHKECEAPSPSVSPRFE